MTVEDDDPYRDDPEGFRLLDRDEYERLDDLQKWAYLKAWCDADARRAFRAGAERAAR
jgi:hypothetical protein